MMADKVRPFSSGTQFADWTSRNCDRCSKGASPTLEPDQWPTCEIEGALVAGYVGDGTITAEIAKRMALEPLALTWECGEFEDE
jgi:hypothetical protein